MATNRKLKILCLHGYRQDAKTFQSKTGGLRKLLKSVAELTFIDAPHEVPENAFINDASGEIVFWKGRKPCELDEDEAEKAEIKNREIELFQKFSLYESYEDIQKEDKNPEKPYHERFRGRSWWFSDDKGSFDSKSRSKNAIGFEASVAAVERAFTSQGPFDGILGFSQGGAFAALICGLKENLKFDHDFKFVIIISGFKSMSLDHHYLYFHNINIPSLHVIGKTDHCISQEQSEKLMSVFNNKTAMNHEGGHYIPIERYLKESYISFIKDAMIM